MTTPSALSSESDPKDAAQRAIEAAAAEGVTIKRRPGRPLGSKGKPKTHFVEIRPASTDPAGAPVASPDDARIQALFQKMLARLLTKPAAALSDAVKGSQIPDEDLRDLGEAAQLWMARRFGMTTAPTAFTIDAAFLGFLAIVYAPIIMAWWKERRKNANSDHGTQGIRENNPGASASPGGPAVGGGGSDGGTQ